MGSVKSCRHCGKDIVMSKSSLYPDHYWHIPSKKFSCRNAGSRRFAEDIYAEPPTAEEIIDRLLTKYR